MSQAPPPPPVSPANDRPHYPVLDGIRGVAIALVLFQHFFQRTIKGDGLLDDVVFGLAERSWMGVDLFFVLSGFLITGILWDAKGREGYFKNFYMRRVLRIFPAYYLVLLLFFVLLPMTGIGLAESYVQDSKPDQLWHWTYLTNFKIYMRGDWYFQHVPNVFWSLAIEEQFYLVWPMVVLWMGRKSLMGLCLFLCALALALRIKLAYDPDVNWVMSFVMTPTRMDGLVFGAFLALLFRSEARHAINVRQIMWALFLLGVGVTVWLTLQRPPGWKETPLQAVRFSSIALLCGASLWLAITAKGEFWMAKVFQWNWLRFLGKYSYALYLWHGPVDTVVRHFLDPEFLVAGSKLPAQLLFTAVALLFSILAALASWHFVEKHCLRWKRSFA